MRVRSAVPNDQKIHHHIGGAGIRHFDGVARITIGLGGERYEGRKDEKSRKDGWDQKISQTGASHSSGRSPQHDFAYMRQVRRPVLDIDQWSQTTTGAGADGPSSCGYRFAMPSAHPAMAQPKHSGDEPCRKEPMVRSRTCERADGQRIIPLWPAGGIRAYLPREKIVLTRLQHRGSNPS